MSAEHGPVVTTDMLGLVAPAMAADLQYLHGRQGSEAAVSIRLVGRGGRLVP